jgi:hypothetical protein
MQEHIENCFELIGTALCGVVPWAIEVQHRIEESAQAAWYGLPCLFGRKLAPVYQPCAMQANPRRTF